LKCGVDISDFAVKTIVAVMDAFHLEKADILAHSMGAHLSLWTAMDRPELVRSLTLLGNPGNVMNGRPPLLMRLIMGWPLNKIVFKFMKNSDDHKKLSFLKFMGSSRETIDALPKEINKAYYCFRRLPHYFISQTSLLQNAAPAIDARQLSQVIQPA
jgi:2-hydroxy-6-oxonona-2,4-dienedioate hydrolase